MAVLFRVNGAAVSVGTLEGPKRSSQQLVAAVYTAFAKLHAVADLKKVTLTGNAVLLQSCVERTSGALWTQEIVPDSVLHDPEVRATISPGWKVSELNLGRELAEVLVALAQSGTVQTMTLEVS